MMEIGKKVGTQEEISVTIPEMSRILLIVRNDADYMKAVENAIYLASGKNPKIYLLYTVDMELPPVVSEKTEKQIYDRLREEGKQIVERSAEQIRAAGLDVEIIGMHFGFAAERILKAEKEVNPDVIVMSTRGLSTLKKILLGSPSEEVSKEAKAPVLLVK